MFLSLMQLASTKLYYFSLSWYFSSNTALSYITHSIPSPAEKWICFCSLWPPCSPHSWSAETQLHWGCPCWSSPALQSSSRTRWFSSSGVLRHVPISRFMIDIDQSSPSAQACSVRGNCSRIWYSDAKGLSCARRVLWPPCMIWGWAWTCRARLSPPTTAQPRIHP